MQWSHLHCCSTDCILTHFLTCLGIKSRSGLWQVHPPPLSWFAAFVFLGRIWRTTLRHCRSRSLAAQSHNSHMISFIPLFEGHIWNARSKCQKPEKSRVIIVETVRFYLFFAHDKIDGQRVCEPNSELTSQSWMFFSFASSARIRKMNQGPKRDTLSEAQQLSRGIGRMKELLIQSPLNLCPSFPPSLSFFHSDHRQVNA